MLEEMEAGGSHPLSHMYVYEILQGQGYIPPPHQHIPNLYLMYTVKCKKCLTKQNKKHFEIKNISTFLPKFRNHSSLGKVRRKLGKVGFVR